jgi:hypothetical protein
MSRTFDYDIFLSYSSKDKKAILALAERLKQDGLRVWLDAWEIKPGDMIGLKIQHGVEKSRTLILCMSQAYFESEWGTLEHHTLLFRDPTNAQRRFIPLLIQDCTLPDIIAQFAHIDWRTPSDEVYAKLLAACRGEEAEAPEPPEPEEQADQARMVLRGHTGDIWGVAVTPNGRTVVSGSIDENLKVWDLETGYCRATLVGHNAYVWCVAVAPDGRTVVSGSSDNTLKVWDLETGKCRATFKGHAGDVECLAVALDGRIVVSGSFDSTLKVWDLETGKCRTTLEGHSDRVACLDIVPDGRTVVSGSFDNTLKVWDLETGHCRATFAGHTEGVRSVTISSNGMTVVSGSNDKTLKVWDFETGHCSATFEGHTEAVASVAIVCDGKRIVSGSSDKTLKIWDFATGLCCTTLEGHTHWIRDLAVTPDNRTIVSGANDNTLRVWDLPQPGEIVKALGASRYTNAKVVLVGETGVGKTGLSLRLCEDRWEPTESTHGMLVSRLEMPPATGPGGMEHEVWLWDFAGQPDYRLIHQLYMDETALGMLVFDPQDDNPFEEIGYWEKALRAATKHQPVKLLVAGRCDRGGITISRKRFEHYVQE